MFGPNQLFGSKDNFQKPYFGQNMTIQSTGVTPIDASSGTRTHDHDNSA